MTRLGRQSAWILLTVLVLVAAIGFEQGLIHGLAAVRADQAVAAVNSEREPVPVATPLSTAAPPMDEATVRRIAKEEADAAVARARPKKAAPKPQDDDDQTDAPTLVPPPSPLLVPPAAIPPTG